MNNQLIEFFFFSDSSCPTNPNRCSDRGQCSIRSPNGNFNCDCLLGYNGTTCEIGIFFHLMETTCFSFKSMEKKLYFFLFFLAFYCLHLPNGGNAEWVQTLANGQIVNGSCINGYYGTVSRKCTQYGSIGNWDSISGSCYGISFTIIIS